MDFLAHGQCADLQLIHINDHLQIAQVVDDAEGAAGGQGVALLGVFLNDGAADGRGNGVVGHIVLLVLHRDLSAAQGLGSRLDGFGQLVAGQLNDDVTLGDRAALLHIDGGNGAAGLSGQGALCLIGKGGRGDGADAIDAGGSGLGGGQTAGIVDPDGDGAHQQVAGAQLIGAGDGGDGAFQRLKGAVQHHVGALAHREVGGVGCREQQVQQHLGAVADDRHLLAAGHLVALCDLEAADGAVHLCADILAVHSLVVAALGLLQGNAGFFQIGGSVRAVDGVEHIALLHLVALFKAAGEDLAVHQRLDGICIGRVQRACAAQGIGDILTDRRRLGVGHIAAGSAIPAAAYEKDSARCRHDDQRHEPFPVLFGKCACTGPTLGSGHFPGSLSRLSRCILFLFPDHAFPPSRCKRA